MQRKVNLVAKNTLTVSLPNRWVRENGIMKGDELEVSLEKGRLSFSKDTISRKKKEISIKIDDFTYLSLARYLSILYKAGYDRIILNYSKNEIIHSKKGTVENLRSTITRLVSRFIGAEITSQSKNRTEIECFLTEETQDLEKIEKRIFFLISDMIDEMIKVKAEEYPAFHEAVYNYHDNITKFIYYYLRSLSRSKVSDMEKEYASVFYNSVDHVIDKIRHVSDKIVVSCYTDKLRRYLSEMFGIFLEGFKMVFERKISQDFIERRYRLKKRIDKESFTKEELRVIGEAGILVDNMGALMECILSRILVENEASRL